MRLKCSKLLVLLLVLVLSLFLVIGCATGNNHDSTSGSSDEEGGGKKRLVFAESFEWEAMDLYQVEWDGLAQTAHTDGLLTFDLDSGEYVPNIASSFEILEGGTVIKLTIPEDLRYGDGTVLKPEDIKRSIEWGLEVSPYNWDYMVIQDITIDGNDVYLHCESYSTTLSNYYLTSFYLSTISADQINGSTQEELLTQARQYAPFYLESIDDYVAGSHVVLKRNEHYRTNNPSLSNQGPALFEELEVKFMPDGFSRVSGLKSGEIDIAADIPMENIKELENDPEIEVIKRNVPGINYMVLNKDNPLFSDINIRKAIALAINRDQIVTANQGYVLPAYSFIVPEMLDYSDEAVNYYRDNYANDIELAKELLADAGWADTDGDGYLDRDGQVFEFSLLSATESTHSKNTLQIMQSDFREIGIKLNVSTAESGYISSATKDDDYDAAILIFIWAEPASILPYLTNDPNNLEDESYYELINEALVTEDDEARIALFVAAQKVMMDELAYIPILQEMSVIAYRNNISGIKFLEDKRIVFNDIEIN